MSTNFGPVDVEHLKFPTTMRVDWVRVYQPVNQINIGCDPIDFPTQAYINQYVYLAHPFSFFLTSGHQIYRGLHKSQPYNLGRRF